MKKTLILATATILFVACNANTYNNEEFNISFNHPSNWEIIENNETQTVKVVSPQNTDTPGSNIVITIPAENFEEYEDLHKEFIANKKMSINSHPKFETDYTSKIYGQEGWLYQIIEINGKYISAGSDMDFTKDHEEGLKEILNSLSF